MINKINILSIIIFLSTLELLISANSFAQQKLPTIQALCHVELNNGDVIDGYLSLGESYDNQHYHPNAFYVETALNKTILPIDLKFTGFYRDQFQKGVTLFYAESKSNNPQFIYKLNEENGQKILNKKTLREEEYRLSNTFKIYNILPLSMKLQAKNLPEDGTTTINIKDVKSFELIKSPERKWTIKIQQAREKLTKKMADDEAKNNPWLGFKEAIWYHEIIKNKQDLSTWSKYFE